MQDILVALGSWEDITCSGIKDRGNDFECEAECENESDNLNVASMQYQNRYKCTTKVVKLKGNEWPFIRRLFIIFLVQVQ